MGHCDYVANRFYSLKLNQTKLHSLDSGLTTQISKETTFKADNDTVKQYKKESINLHKCAVRELKNLLKAIEKTIVNKSYSDVWCASCIKEAEVE